MRRNAVARHFTESVVQVPPNHCMQPAPSQSSNLHTQLCRLSGARLMLAVRRHGEIV